MKIVNKAKDPIVLSYLALRKAVGGVAVCLPVVLAIPWWFVSQHAIQSSISGYYYTGMRNVFVGSLCAIAMFMLCCRGYDRNDEISGILSAAFGLGVAFFPTAPDTCATEYQTRIGVVHYIFAGLLFSILAYFCLVLFKMTAKEKILTRRKVQRNLVYTICGWVIVASMALMIVCNKLLNVKHVIGPLTPTFCFESTALVAFGVAWLTKGETFLQDEKPQLRRTQATATNQLFSLSTPPSGE